LLIFVFKEKGALSTVQAQNVTDFLTIGFRKKRHPFYICDNFVRCHPILPIRGRKIPIGNLKQTQFAQLVLN